MEHHENEHPFRGGTLLALAAAILFGLTTPLIQRAGGGAGAIPVAACLYAGAALASVGRLGARGQRESPLRLDRVPRVLAIAFFGGLLAPACLAWGLQHTGAAGASLLLNLEAVFTVLLGWLLFREPIGRRVIAALALMVAGGASLVPDARQGGIGGGALAVVAATLAWAIDNVLTRPLADVDPRQVVRLKGAIGAALGFALSLSMRQPFPTLPGALVLLACGATGYGVSLRLYLRAQRAIGAGRTASVFALGPFVGAALALLMGDRNIGGSTAFAALCFGAGAFLHATERHSHLHVHESLEHEHAHRHDDGHHNHVHDPPVAGEHSHPHRHEPRMHAHPHAPDAHHQHRH